MKDFLRHLRSAGKKLLFQILAVLVVVLVCVGVWQGVAAWRDREPPEEHTKATVSSSETTEGETVPMIPNINFEKQREDAADIIAWLTIDHPEVDIDYPVVQTSDNQYYVKYTPAGKRSKYGAIFLDFRSNSDFSDFYNVIYGHNIISDRSGLMFTKLVKFDQKEIFDAIPAALLYTPEQVYELQFFSCAITDHMSDYYLKLAFVSPAEKQAHLAMLQETALYWRDIPIENDDRIVVLSTCYYSLKGVENARLVVLGKLVPVRTVQPDETQTEAATE